jgi:hypothetical protein
MSDLVDISAASLDPQTNAVRVQAKSAQIGGTEDDAPGFDDAPLFGALGIAAVPWPKDERGNAQAVVDESIPGYNGVITGMRDARAAGIVQELGPGETAIHSTGPDFDSVVFLKKQMLALMVGDDMAFVMDRDAKKITLTAFGMVLEFSPAQGITLTNGQATMQMFGPLISLAAPSVVLGGRVPLAPVLYPSVPGKPVVGMPSPEPNSALAAMGVFIGA